MRYTFVARHSGQSHDGSPVRTFVVGELFPATDSNIVELPDGEQISRSYAVEVETGDVLTYTGSLIDRAGAANASAISRIVGHVVSQELKVFGRKFVIGGKK